MLEFDPLDEYPIHQVPLPMRYVATGDRNVYDRCIFHGIDKTGEAYFITGLGVYPNLGVIDAYAVVRRGDVQHAVRMSAARPDDKMAQVVGDHYRIEVVEPFRELRLVCDADDHGVGFDLTWRSRFGPISEPQHVRRSGDKLLLDASRFAGVGTWEGELRVAGDTYAVTPDRFFATRDRSWGIRPVGEPEPQGRPKPFGGMWWWWSPLQFPSPDGNEFALHVILEEDPSGFRTTNYAAQLFPSDTGREPEQLGWPLPTISYRSGTRWPTAASVDLVDRAGKTHTLEIEPIVGIPLSVGCGYGADPDWSHGLWKGESWVDGATYDLNDPAVAGRLPFSMVDHLARATYDGHEGWGIFEHWAMGPHVPSGFVDLVDGAP